MDTNAVGTGVERDAVADPWGARTPYPAGGDWPVRVDRYLADGVAPDDVQRWVPTASLLHSNGDAMDIAVRDGMIVGVRGRAGERPGQPWPAGPEGPVRVAGQRVARPPHPAADPPRRAAGRDRLGHGPGPGGRRDPAAAGGARTVGDRLLHHRAAVRRGVLHARRDRARRDRHRPPALADVVLPAATWGRRPAAWAASTQGRPCDYTGLSHARLRDAASGITWPCSHRQSEGTERLYADGRFWTELERCESFGRDLVTGAPLDETQYRALDPAGRAVLKAAEYLPPHERPSAEYPFALVTGRTQYHFHTRTQTGRVPQLQAAAPQVWVECSAGDARRLGLEEGDLTEVTTRRGVLRARLRIGGIRLHPEPRWENPVVNGVARRAATALRGRPETGLILLADLRRLYRLAAGVALDWEVLGQAAQAMRRSDLLELARTCHPQALRVRRWAEAQVKVVSPQVIAS